MSLFIDVISFCHLFLVLISQDFAYVLGCSSVFSHVKTIKSLSRIEFFSCLYNLSFWVFCTTKCFSYFVSSRVIPSRKCEVFTDCCLFSLAAGLLRILCADSNIREQVKVFDGIPICLR